MADHITLPRVTVEQALSLCESVQGLRTDDEDGSTVWCQELIEALRAALAQAEPVQEPVACSNTFGCRCPKHFAAQQAEPVQGPFALPCPTPKACREHCCSGHCIPRATSPQQAEPVPDFRLTECVFVGPPPAPHEDWHHAISAMLREKHISGLRISTATADDWNGTKQQAEPVQRKPARWTEL